jgi:cytochrome P450
MDADPERYEEPPNPLEGMLTAQRTDGTFSEDDIVGNMFTILLAGEHTTANTLGWTIWLLASRPEIQARLAGEAQEILGDGELPVEHERVEKLAYTGAVLGRVDAVEEGQPTARDGTGRGRDDLRHAYPCWTRLLLLLRSAGSDAAGRSEEFYPERWLEDSDDTRAPQSLAFGAGPRFCPGRNLAFLRRRRRSR